MKRAVKKIVWTILITSLFLRFTLFSYIYQVRVVGNKKQNVIGCSDYHEKGHISNGGHRHHIEHLFTRTNAAETKFVVEDLASSNDEGRRSCLSYAIGSQESVLGGIADVARKKGCDVANIEYRYCRVTGVGPLLNNVDKKSGLCTSCNSLTMDLLYQEVLHEMDMIKKYDDGKILNDVYRKAIQEVSLALKRLHLNYYKTFSLVDYCNQMSKGKYSDTLQNLCIFDSALVDMKIVHSIVSSQNKSTIIVVAGGTHIDNAFALLARVGYETVGETQVVFSGQQVIKSSLGSQVNSSDEVAPLPVDISMIDTFIK